MPLDPKLQKFTTASPAIATYDYFHFAEGTGIKIFYGTHAKVTTVDHYLLLGTATASNEIQSFNEDVADKDPAYFELYDLDFDTSPFNLPKDIKGTAYISIPFMVMQDSGSISGYIIAKLRHVDAADTPAETEIASAQSETFAPTGEALKKKLLIPITVPLTHFKQGETLRLTIGVWYKSLSPGNPNKVAIGHDPKGRVGTAFPGTGDYKVTTVMEAHIPFRLG